MNKLIYILIFFISNNLFSQIEIDWFKLRDVYYKSEYREDIDGYFQTPYFGEEVESLDGKEVKITRCKNSMDKIKEMGFTFAFKGGLSFCLGDIIIPDEKHKMIDSENQEVEKHLYARI